MDLETTGLDPNHDRILEVGVVVTTNTLEILGSKAWLVRCPIEVVEQCQAVELHRDSGLLDRLRDETSQPLEEVEREVCAFLNELTGDPAGLHPLAGSSVHFDRNFIRKWMPETFAYLHYRNIDVSTIHQLIKRWRPRLRPPWVPRKHRALSDVLDAIEELRWYQAHLFDSAPVIARDDEIAGLEALAAREHWG